MNTDLKTIYTGLTNGQHSSEENGIRGFYETAGLVKSYEYIFLPRLSSSPGREDFAILRRSGSGRRLWWRPTCQEYSTNSLDRWCHPRRESPESWGFPLLVARHPK